MPCIIGGAIGGIIGGCGGVAGISQGCGAFVGTETGGAKTAAGMGAAGEVTVWPHVGHGPLTPAIWTGTVSCVRQAAHSNWITSGDMPEINDNYSKYGS